MTPTPTGILERLLGHDAWTTRRLLDIANGLDDEQLDRDFDIGHRTVRLTFDHILWNIECWTDLMRGVEVRPRPEPTGSVAELIQRHESATSELTRFARNLVARGRLDERFLDHLDDPPREKSFGGTLVHLATHGMHHRAQLLYLLRRLGVKDLPEGDALSWEQTLPRQDAVLCETNPYLASTDIIDWDPPRLRNLANAIVGERTSTNEVVASVFEWVRDKIEHCIDYDRDEVTCRASEVLHVGTGFCYAKSHLLAALLRAKGVPTGFCYQRLSTGPGSFCLHGLNAVHLDGIGWYRIDPRGNNDSVRAEFCPPREVLAFEVSEPGEADLPEVWADPLPIVVSALRSTDSATELRERLPDVPLSQAFLAPTRESR